MAKRMYEEMPGSTGFLNVDLRSALRQRYVAVRSQTVQLCDPLVVEDFQLQSMPDCSPPKWHLAHTTWFFETFLLAVYRPNHRPYHPQYGYLFNSYYNSVGSRWPRPSRGLLSRPTVAEIRGYRQTVDAQMAELLDTADEATLTQISPLLELGLHHEQQHQELLLTDLKHAFSLNPLVPIYSPRVHRPEPRSTPLHWEAVPAGVQSIGHEGDDFAFDNETPRHSVYLTDFEIASRLVTVAEYQEFIAAGGYQHPEHWLSDGWAACQQHGWQAPLYWQREGSTWTLFTLAGRRLLEPDEPVCHISFYEADAFARWSNARLPTEFEWEFVAAEREVLGNFSNSGHYHPQPDSGTGQYYGDVWEWTASPYIGYPGFRPAAGAVGEYNGKFMCNQFVLRGGSCVTPPGHIRPTYRNFFPPDARWQFTGLRLARDA